MPTLHSAYGLLKKIKVILTCKSWTVIAFPILINSNSNLWLEAKLAPIVSEGKVEGTKGEQEADRQQEQYEHLRKE